MRRHHTFCTIKRFALDHTRLCNLLFKRASFFLNHLLISSKTLQKYFKDGKLYILNYLACSVFLPCLLDCIMFLMFSLFSIHISEDCLFIFKTLRDAENNCNVSLNRRERAKSFISSNLPRCSLKLHKTFILIFKKNFFHERYYISYFIYTDLRQS